MHAKQVVIASLLIYLCILYFTLIRREVYRILQEEGIDLPRFAVLNRDPDKPEGQCAADDYDVFIFLQRRD